MSEEQTVLDMNESAPPLSAPSWQPDGTWIERAGSRLRAALFRISTDETRVQRRGFAVRDPAVAARLETVGMHFVNAYNDAVAANSLPPLVSRLEVTQAEYRGFAYEGASMGLSIRDAVCPGRPLWPSFIDGPAASQNYISHVGRGWAFARLPGSADRHARSLTGPLRWLSFDGYGFHQGFFDWRRSIDQCRPDRRLRRYATRAFDQGLGRSLWFVRGADVPAIVQAIARFPSLRHADLWAGVGLAATYAGGLSPQGLLQLVKASGRHRSWLAQGAVFAAEARHRAGIVMPATEIATQCLCEMACVDAAELAVRTKPDETLDDPEGCLYEAWRRAIQWNFI